MVSVGLILYCQDAGVLFLLTHFFPRIGIPDHKAYSEDELDMAKTHDLLWNAAQIQLKTEGKMHGFLRYRFFPLLSHMLHSYSMLHFYLSPFPSHSSPFSFTPLLSLSLLSFHSHFPRFPLILALYVSPFTSLKFPSFLCWCSCISPHPNQNVLGKEDTRVDSGRTSHGAPSGTTFQRSLLARWIGSEWLCRGWVVNLW